MSKARIQTQETGTVWSVRPSAITERVVDRLATERNVSRNRLIEFALRATFFQETMNEMKKAHAQELAALEAIRVAAPPIEIQQEIARTLDLFVGDPPWSGAGKSGLSKPRPVRVRSRNL